MGRFRSAIAAAPTAVFSSTAARVRELEGADRVIQAPHALSRRIAFTQLSGGTGASAVSASVAGVLAHRRAGPVLGVNASGGRRTLLWYSSVSDGAGAGDGAHDRKGELTTAESRRLRASTFAEASAALPRSTAGLYALDVRADNAMIAATEADWARRVTPITRFFDVVCTDWGVRRPEHDLGGIAAGSHAVCLVSRADRTCLERAAAVATALRGLESRPHVVVAAVDLGHMARRAPEVVQWNEGCIIVRIPFDPARASASPAAGDLSFTSRLAQTRLAAELMPTLRPPAVGGSIGLFDGAWA